MSFYFFYINSNSWSEHKFYIHNVSITEPSRHFQVLFVAGD